MSLLAMEATRDAGDDPFAAAAAEHPGAKLERIVDPSLGVEWIIAVPPESPWFELLADRQTTQIERLVPVP